MPQRADELPGRGRIAEFVHESLERDGVPERIVPLVLLLGRRGAGKTAVLDLLDGRYRDVRPYVRINLADDPDVDALRVLVAVKWGLSRKVPTVAPISFPRFELGLLALGLDPDDTGQARRAQVDALLKGQGLAQRINRIQRDWAQRLEPLLGAYERQLLVMIAADVLGWALSHLGARDRKRTASWYDEYAVQADGLGAGPGSDALADLCTWSDAEVATALCAALLTDLRTGFNKHGGRGRTTNCLVLLDDVDTEVGTGFLELLARCRRESPPDQGPDPLVVVAARGWQPDADLGVGPAVDAGDDSLRSGGRFGRAGDAEPSQWSAITLTDLGGADAAKLVRSHVLGSQPRDAQFVHALSRGHPGATRRLATALAAGGDARGLLDQRLRDDLIAAVLPREIEEPMLEALTVCAATPGMDHGACDSVFRYLGWRNDLITVREVRDFVRATLWAERDGGRTLIPHPLLRLLLSRRLADQPERWREVHEQFAAHYTRIGDDDIARYHDLALVTDKETARFTAVAAHLDAEFKRPTAAAWHAKLRRIAAAPNRLRTTADPRVTVTELAGELDEGDRRRVVSRLLAALWLHGDRLFDPRGRLTQVVRDEYAHLGGKAGADGGEFYTASEDY